MITDNQRLTMDYRDSELWKNDFPTSYGNVDNKRCSKCGEAFDGEIRISVNISNAHGIEHYDYHKSCVGNALDNASIKQKTQPTLKVPFKGSERNMGTQNPVKINQIIPKILDSKFTDKMGSQPF